MEGTSPKIELSGVEHLNLPASVSFKMKQLEVNVPVARSQLPLEFSWKQGPVQTQLLFLKSMSRRMPLNPEREGWQFSRLAWVCCERDEINSKIKPRKTMPVIVDMLFVSQKHAEEGV